MKIIGYIHPTNKTAMLCRKCVPTHSNTPPYDLAEAIDALRNCRKIYDFASPWIEREIVGRCAICHADICGTENRHTIRR